jgi:tetratricopeptide (TPR) repeat protein
LVYTDLIIQLSKKSPNHYIASALKEDKPVASSPFELNLNELRVLERLKTLEEVALSPKSVETFHVDFGQELYKTVMAGELGTYFQESLDKADEGLRLSLQFDDNAKELMALPWEFLHDGEDFLVAKKNTLISRMPSKTRRLQSKPLESMLRMLVVVSSPNDPSCAPLNSEQERERIVEAVDRLYVNHKMDVDFTEDATFETIQSYLTEKDYHIVHFTGHGRQTDGQGYLVLETDDGRARDVDIQAISDLFAGRGIRLVVLSACQSSGLASILVKSKVPAVVAMQYSVLDTSATVFASAFYQALASGKAVDLALVEARIAMRNVKEGNKVDFATPVLYLLDPNCLDIGQIKPSAPDLFLKPTMLGEVPVMKKGFVGRQRELRLIQKDFMSDIKRAAIIYGFGGIGKTVLATRLAQRMDHHFDGIFGFKCQPQTKQEDILNGLNAFLNLAGIPNLNQLLAQPIPIQAKVAALVSILNQRRFLVILDNFESCLDESRTKIADAGLKEFVTHLLNATVANTKYIITTRYDFDPLDGRLVGAIEHLPLAEMPLYQAIWLMNSHSDLAKLDSKKKVQIFKSVGGHPWTIGMFARHASTGGADNLLLQLEPLKKELREFVLFDKSYSMLDPASKELLIRASIFEEAVPLVALQWMMGDESQPSPSVDEPLEKLMHWGLMAKLDEGDETLYSVHTLVKDFVSNEAEGEKADRKKLLVRAAEYYEDKTKVSKSLWDLLHARDYYYLAGDLDDRTGRKDQAEIMWDRAASIVISAWEHLHRWGYIELAISLLSQSAKTTSGTAKAVATGNLAIIYMYLGDMKTALNLHSEVKEIFEKEGDKRNVAAALHEMGVVNKNQGNYPEAIKLYQHGLDLFREVDDKQGIATSLHDLGFVHQDQGNYPEAIKLYQESLDIKKELGDKHGISQSMNNLGMIYQDQGNYPEAIKLYQESLDIEKKLGDKRGIAISLHNLGMFHQKQGNYPEAIKLYEESLDIKKELGDKLGISTTLHQLGTIHQDQSNYAEATKLYKQSLDISKELGDKRGIAHSLGQLGFVHQDQGNYIEAAKLYEECLNISKELGDKRSIAISLYQLGMIDEASGDHDEALGKCTLALSIFEELNAPNREIIKNSIGRLREEMGEDAFNKALERLEGS